MNEARAKSGGFKGCDDDDDFEITEGAAAVRAAPKRRLDHNKSSAFLSSGGNNPTLCAHEGSHKRQKKRIVNKSKPKKMTPLASNVFSNSQDDDFM